MVLCMQLAQNGEVRSGQKASPFLFHMLLHIMQAYIYPLQYVYNKLNILLFGLKIYRVERNARSIFFKLYELQSYWNMYMFFLQLQLLHQW